MSEEMVAAPSESKLAEGHPVGVQPSEQTGDQGEKCPVDHGQLAKKPLHELPTPPGTNGWPLVGDMLELMFRGDNFAKRRQAMFGKVFYANIFGARMVNMSGSAGHDWVFRGENKYLQNRWTSTIRQLQGSRSLSLIIGEEHRERRRMYSSAFRYDAMAEFIPIMHRIVTRTLSEWAARGGILTIVPAMRALTFEIATAFVFGESDEFDLAELMHEFETIGAGMFAIPINAPFTPFGKALRGKKRMYEIIGQVIANRHKRGETGGGVLGTLLKVRDKDGQPLPDETIVHDIHIMLFAGHETTISANAYIMMFLAQYPEVMARVRAEQAGLSDADLLSPEGLKQMRYGDNVINETLRYYPPVGGFFRVMTEDTEYEGFRIPAGYAIGVTPASTHRNPALWTEPDKFDPDRFARGEDKAHPHSFIPFGGGPRVCLGQNLAMLEMRLIVAVLAREYQWELVPNQDLKPRIFPMPTPKGGIQVRFARKPEPV